MTRIERLTGILLLLQTGPRTSEQIARTFEVSRRTILRDVQALSEMGVPIFARDGAGGGYSLPDDYSLTTLPLTTHETFLLQLALSGLTRLADTPFAEALATLQAKLQSLLPSDHQPHVETLLATIRVDVPDRSQRAPFLEPLIEATQHKRWVQITYQSAERVSCQRILPRQVFVQSGLWYCRAYAWEREGERTYRVDRIQTLTMVDADFQPTVPAPQLPYHDETHPQIEATLTPRGVAYLETEPDIGRLIQRRADGSGSLVLRCPPSELDYYARFFVRYASDITVHAPPELRQRLQAIGHQLLKAYPER